MTDMEELVDFLRAALDEDERDAPDIHTRDCAVGNYRGFNDGCDCGWPKRVLGEVEARRAIIEECVSDLARSAPKSNLNDAAWTTLRLLAQPYAGRPGWREEWRA